MTLCLTESLKGFGHAGVEMKLNSGQGPESWNTLHNRRENNFKFQKSAMGESGRIKKGNTVKK